MKLDQYQIILPYYFGWFLNSDDSLNLINTAKEILKEFFKYIPKFEQDLNSKPVQNINYQTKSLHCTTKYIGKNKKTEEIQNYVKNPLLALSIGKFFRIKIIGFSYSESTIGNKNIKN
jgi:hypothetical protein